MKFIVVAGLEKLCTLLDAIPRYTAKRWWRYGDWGCQLGLSMLSGTLDQRWGGTGYWRACSAPNHVAAKRKSSSE